MGLLALSQATVIIPSWLSKCEYSLTYRFSPPSSPSLFCFWPAYAPWVRNGVTTTSRTPSLVSPMYFRFAQTTISGRTRPFVKCAAALICLRALASAGLPRTNRDGFWALVLVVVVAEMSGWALGG